MLCGLLEPTAGDVQLAGAAATLRSEAVRQRSRLHVAEILPVRRPVDSGEPAISSPASTACPSDERDEKMRWVLSFSGLEGKQDQITGSLPGGWKQRVAFGAAIMHEPSVLFLDEPTSGVDPLARRAFWTMINRLADAGTAILVTTHYLEEAEQCNRLGMMVAGELVAEGTPERHQGPADRATCLEFVVDQPQRAADLLKNDTERWRVSLFGDRLHVITDEDAASGEKATRRTLEANGIRVHADARRALLAGRRVHRVVEKARQQGKVGLRRLGSGTMRRILRKAAKS